MPRDRSRIPLFPLARLWWTLVCCARRYLLRPRRFPACAGDAVGSVTPVPYPETLFGREP